MLPALVTCDVVLMPFVFSGKGKNHFLGKDLAIECLLRVAYCLISANFPFQGDE
jgi:hypothetical protein